MIHGIRVSENIRFRKVDGAVMILDLRSESYFALDPVATDMWESLGGFESFDAVVQALHEKYGVERDRLAGDLQAFLDRSLAQGFLRRAEERETPIVIQRRGPEVGRKRFLAWRAWWSLFRTVRLLSKKGFTETYRRYAAIPAPRVSPDVDERLPRAVEAFARAEDFFHMKRAPEDCLPRSLALFRFLRSVGIPAEHCIGARRFPLRVHAWVEVCDQSVQDNPLETRAYERLATVTT